MSLRVWLSDPGGLRCHHCGDVVVDIARCLHFTELCLDCLVADPCTYCAKHQRRGWEHTISLDDYVPPSQKKETACS